MDGPRQPDRGKYGESILPDDLDGQDLRVRKLRSGTAPSNTPTLEMIVDEAEDAKTMKVLRSMNGRPPFVLDGLEHHRA
jgi:hypothetical protein